MYFSQISKFDDSKNTSVNQRKSKNHEELNFSREKVQKYEKNRESKNGKCEILRPISGAEICLKNDGHKRPLLEAQIEESFQKKIYRKKKDFMITNMKKLKDQKWCQNGSNSII